MKKILKNNVFIVVITFLVPSLIAIISRDSFSIYNKLVKPSFSPPVYVFPIVWNILYILMAISFILIKESENSKASLYYVQLILNSIWTLIFFKYRLYFLALIDLLIFLFIVLYMTYKFYEEDKRTLYLLLPYIAWTVYASYLNFYIASYN